jgi:hypothetical protein
LSVLGDFKVFELTFIGPALGGLKQTKPWKNACHEPENIACDQKMGKLSRNNLPAPE